MELLGLYWAYIGIRWEKKMETYYIIVGLTLGMEKKMETYLVGYFVDNGTLGI